MRRKGPDNFSGNLFEEAGSQKPPEKIVDDEGNVYDESLRKIGEVPSELLVKALEIARRTDPDAQPGDELTQMRLTELKRAEKLKQKSK